MGPGHDSPAKGGSPFRREGGRSRIKNKPDQSSISCKLERSKLLVGSLTAILTKAQELRWMEWKREALALARSSALDSIDDSCGFQTFVSRYKWLILC